MTGTSALGHGDTAGGNRGFWAGEGAGEKALDSCSLRLHPHHASVMEPTNPVGSLPPGATISQTEMERLGCLQHHTH